MMHVARVSRGDTVLIHGASGAVGLSAVQQARVRGARVIGTASEQTSRSSGISEQNQSSTEPAWSGACESSRGRCRCGTGYRRDGRRCRCFARACSDRSRIVTTSAFQRAQGEGFRFIGGGQPESAAYRDSARATLVSLAGRGDLTVPIARTFPLTEAPAALKLIGSGHPGGKLALLP